jgi:EAL domain-containing protein (putative c-di-GMP-specific phosphodiesterase class I)
VLTTVFNWYGQNPNRFEKVSMVCVNLSGQSLSDMELLNYIIKFFENSELQPQKFCFEVTETAAIANLTYATNFIKRLKDLGCHFALDDFGSGLSSFAYLKNLPVDFIKIDGLFVKDILDDPIDLAMVKSINEIGQVMGKTTIAEFVENNDILAKLREVGVDYAQGYAVSKPRPLITSSEVTKVYNNL